MFAAIAVLIIIGSILAGCIWMGVKSNPCTGAPLTAARKLEPLPEQWPALPPRHLLAAYDAMKEIDRARQLWGTDPFASAHEGYAVALEEFDELKVHVWTNQRKRDLEAMRKEAIQAAAMCLRFAAECCEPYKHGR